ncbi:cytochrome c [Pseudothauera nasutitermitis]|uniref:Cytochrome c n=1 Tax=Pseudothauera nasutitermitis TaxID=2565930 RepID=A0A4V6RX53_9RHOO|nr:cytochrome c [Pseudothauera nasutitermitis]THF62317.1 cytochrome c [Pseudothauera nasutitermitis]
MPRPRTLPHRLLPPALLATLLAACGPVEDTRPGQPVKHRQEAFKEILRDFEPMGVMLREGDYRAEAFAPHAERLLALSERPWGYFGPDTDYPPSRSKGIVWSRPDDFERERQRFLLAVERLAEAAAAHDEARARETYQAVYDSCRDCHREFRK